MGKNQLRVVLVILLLMIGQVLAEDKQVSSLQQQLKEIGSKFGVNIIADPTLNPPVSNVIKGESAETALISILEPLGYSFSKVDNYYLVNGPDLPLTIMAEADSSMIPVGFLDEEAQTKLAEFRQYLTYDQSMGVVYLKAPTSQMNKLLAKLWELTRAASELSVIYNLQIMDLADSSDFDFLFSGKYHDKQGDKEELVITPNEWTVDSDTQLYVEKKAAEYSERLSRQPWLMTLPGKTVEFGSSMRYLNGKFDLNRFFTIKITPIQVDQSSGRIISDIKIQRDLINDSDLTENRMEQTSDRVYNISSIIRTTPGKREILAIVRQIEYTQTKILWGLGNKKKKIHRDLIIMVSATPINIQTTLAKSTGLIPVASLSGIDRLADPENSEVQDSGKLNIGLYSDIEENKVNGWLELSVPLGLRTDFRLDYRKTKFSTGFSYYFDSARQTSLELLAGHKVGPEDQDALMLGIGDMTRPRRQVTLFAKYYPWSYLLDTEKSSYERVWLAGTRVGTEKSGLSLTALGNPDFDGWRLKLDFNVKKQTWVLEVDTTKQKPAIYGGLGFSF